MKNSSPFFPCLLLCFLLPAATRLQAQAFYTQSFGTGTSLPLGWSASDSRISANTTVPSSGYSASATSPQASGGSNVIFQSCTPIPATLTLSCSGVVSTIGLSNIRIGFGRRTSGSFSPQVSLEWSSDGTNWNLVSSDIATGGTTSWGFLFFDLPASADNVSNLRFRFVFTTNFNGGCAAAPNFRIDDFTVGSNNTLPISLRDFRASKVATRIQLRFSTATELNNSHFVIERSGDARDFKEIGQVQGAGTTRIPQSYTFTDEKPLSGVNYYRLRQVDFDGMESFSPVVSVVFGKTGYISIAPSPATDRVRIQLEESYDNDGLWQVYDNTGRQVLSGTWEAESTDYELNVNTLPEGMYTFRLVAGAQVQVTQFVKS